MFDSNVAEQLRITRELTDLRVFRSAKEVIIVTEYIARLIAEDRQAIRDLAWQLENARFAYAELCAGGEQCRVHDEWKQTAKKHDAAIRRATGNP